MTNTEQQQIVGKNDYASSAVQTNSVDGLSKWPWWQYFL